MRTNPHGQKYLVYSNGKSQNCLLINSNLYSSLHLQVSSDCKELIDYVLWSWFHDEKDEEWDGKFAHKKAELLFYPSLRGLTGDTLDIRIHLNRVMGLNDLNIEQELRNSPNWISFLGSVGAVDASHEGLLQALAEEIEKEPVLLESAMLDKGAKHGRFVVEHAEQISYLMANLNFFSYSCIHFLFSELSKDKRIDLLEQLLRMNTIHRQWIYSKLRYAVTSAFAELEPVISKSPTGQWMPAPAPIDVKSASTEEKQELVALLLDALTQAESSLAAHPQHYACSLEVYTGLAEVYYRWYSQKILTPLFASTVTKDEAVQMIEHTFGEFNASDGLEFVTTESGATVCHFIPCEKHDTEEQGTVFETILSMSAVQPAEREVLLSDGQYCVWDMNGNRIKMTALYSLDEIMQIFQSGVQELDTQLEELNKEITPSNRMAYLRLREYVTDELAWEYYWAGLTHRNQIVAALSCHLSVEDVNTYKNLPNKIFYELIQLHSGIKLEQPF